MGAALGHNTHIHYILYVVYSTISLVMVHSVLYVPIYKNQVGAVFMVFSVVQICRDEALGHYSMYIDQWCTLDPGS